MSRLTTAFIIKVSSIVIASLGIVFYAAYTARGLIIGPRITVLHPENGSSTTTAAINLYGKVRSSKKLTLNDFPISITSEGAFFETVLLHEGYNILRITNTDRFGRTDTQLLEFNRQAIASSTKSTKKLSTSSPTLSPKK